jgi:hypothetical protein
MCAAATGEINVKTLILATAALSLVGCASMETAQRDCAHVEDPAEYGRCINRHMALQEAQLNSAAASFFAGYNHNRPVYQASPVYYQVPHPQHLVIPGLGIPQSPSPLPSIQPTFTLPQPY